MFYIVVYGFFNRNDVYESFLKGVKEGFQIVIEIAPTMISITRFDRNLSCIRSIRFFLRTACSRRKALHIPVEVIPVFIVRIFSSSAAVSFVLIFLKNMVRIQGLE